MDSKLAGIRSRGPHFDWRQQRIRPGMARPAINPKYPSTTKTIRPIKMAATPAMAQPPVKGPRIAKKARKSTPTPIIPIPVSTVTRILNLRLHLRSVGLAASTAGGNYLGRKAQSLPHLDHRAVQPVGPLDIDYAGPNVVRRIVLGRDRPYRVPRLDHDRGVSRRSTPVSHHSQAQAHRQC